MMSWIQHIFAKPKALTTSPVISLLTFLITSTPPAAYGDVVGIPGSLDLNDVPKSQLVKIGELVDHYQSNELNYSELLEWDPWELWLLLNISQEAERKSAMDDSRTFKFSIHGTGYEDCVIRAESLVGGRSYIRDQRWNCERLIFRSELERKRLGTWMEQWFRKEPMTESEALHFFLAIPFPHRIVHQPYDDPEQNVREQTANFRFIAPLLGDFLLEETLNDFVFSVAFEFYDSYTRQRCLRGIASTFQELPTKTKTNFSIRLLTRIDELNKLENADDRGEGSELELLHEIQRYVAKK